MSSSAPRRKLASEASPFSYPDANPTASEPATSTLRGATDEEQSRQQQASAFEQGRQHAFEQARVELEAAVVRTRESMARALEQFQQERHTYYRRIEREVVELALAIARKVLHREVQIDPQTLAGIVRLTLETLDAGTQVTLYVNPGEVAGWRRYFGGQEQNTQTPNVHEDPAVPSGECRIETSLGSTQAGLALQLKEIETGLLDLLAERPGLPADMRSSSRPAASPAPSPSLAPEQD
jgi:flagellar assembly protein FliH